MRFEVVYLNLHICDIYLLTGDVGIILITRYQHRVYIRSAAPSTKVLPRIRSSSIAIHIIATRYVPTIKYTIADCTTKHRMIQPPGHHRRFDNRTHLDILFHVFVAGNSERLLKVYNSLIRSLL